MGGGTSALQLIPKSCEGRAPPDLPRLYPGPIAAQRFWDLQPRAKLADGDIGYTKLLRDLLGRPLPYHGEGLFAGDLSLHHAIQFKMETLELISR